MVQIADVFRLRTAVSLPIWGQHVEEIRYGPNTGGILPESLLKAGAVGTLLNHSEKKIPLETVRKTSKRIKSLGMKVLLCCDSIEKGKEMARLKPDYLAYEPPEYIGNREISVATAKPEVIAEFVKRFFPLPVIIGAGVHSSEDVQAGLKLGAKGVLVATDIVLAEDPKKELQKLARGFK